LTSAPVHAGALFCPFGIRVSHIGSAKHIKKRILHEKVKQNP